MYGFETVSLDGVWDFKFIGDVDINSVTAESIIFDDVMAVPCCFDATPKYASLRGVAVYSREVDIESDSPMRFYFDGVHHFCRVFIDDKLLGEHIGGFTQFSFDSPAGLSGKHRLSVVVDNRINYDQCPLHLEYFDWYHFGGISRAVKMRQLDNVNIESVRFITQDFKSRKLRAEIFYSCLDSTGEDVLVTVSFASTQRASQSHSLDKPSGTIVIDFDAPECDLWSCEHPALYELKVNVGTQSWSGMTGIREIVVSGREFLLNGESVRPMGFCRHEAHPQSGHTQPLSLLVSDLQQLRDMGANFVRGSHYPQDQRFLDLCDRLGILVWCESIGWQHTAEQLNDEKFISAQKTNIIEMVTAAQNNPSVIMWGILNESESQKPESRAAYETLLGLLRKLDDSRPVTYACNHPFDDKCMDLSDVVSINAYPGWYCSELDTITQKLDELYETFDSSEAGKDKPLIISEVGAGAIYGWRDRHATRWSEQYQCNLLEIVLEHIVKHPERFSGLAIWQFCDLRTSQFARTALGRPRDFNNKGVVDEYRREKGSYELVRSFLTSKDDKK